MATIMIGSDKPLHLLEGPLQLIPTVILPLTLNTNVSTTTGAFEATYHTQLPFAMEFLTTLL